MSSWKPISLTLVLQLGNSTVGLAAEPIETPTPFPSNEAKTKATRAGLSEFFAYYDDQLQQIKDQPTAVKQDELGRALLKKMDDKLRPQVWEFHCPIREVEDLGQNHFKISHGPPDELGEAKQWGYRRSTTLFLSREEAGSLKPGDYVVYSGAPRFASNDSPAEYFSRYFSHNRSSTRHSIQLTSMKIKLQKANSTKEDSESVAR